MGQVYISYLRNNTPTVHHVHSCTNEIKLKTLYSPT